MRKFKKYENITDRNARKSELKRDKSRQNRKECKTRALGLTPRQGQKRDTR